MDILARTTKNSQLRINKKKPFIQNGIKKDYCYTKLVKQKTKRKNNARTVDFTQLEFIKKIELLDKIKFFNEKKRKSTSKKARVENFILNNISKKTIKNNKDIAYKKAVVLLSSKL